jgi:ABC transport permease subunit
MARTIGQESIDLTQVVADPEALKLVNQDFARRNRVLPIAFDAAEQVLTIATTEIFNVVAIWGGYLVGVKWLGVDMGAFWNNMQSSVDFYQDVLNGIIKTVVFGFVVTWIAVYQGFYSVPTAPGISLATTRSVVYASLAVLGLDFVLTAVMLKGW